jgi:NADH-quinone oxidoreductase subunit A
VTDRLSSYAVLVGTAVIGVAVVALSLGANKLLRPVRPSAAKLTTYECGLDSVGEGWVQIHVRYYAYAYLAIIFAVDAAFLFPWATIFASPGFGMTTLGEMFAFLGLLGVGLLYAWRTGALSWAPQGGERDDDRATLSR